MKQRLFYTRMGVAQPQSGTTNGCITFKSGTQVLRTCDDAVLKLWINYGREEERERESCFALCCECLCGLLEASRCRLSSLHVLVMPDIRFQLQRIHGIACSFSSART